MKACVATVKCFDPTLPCAIFIGKIHSMLTRSFLSFLVLAFVVSCTPSKKENTKPTPDPAAQSLIRKLKHLDVPLGKPQPGDWLYANNEKGQAFEQYKAIKPVKPDSIRNTIYVLPLGDFSAYQDSLIDTTTDYLALFFNLRAVHLPTISDEVIPKKNAREFSDGSRQLLTTDILNYLRANMPEDALVMMAITSSDLYAGADYNFVFGQARAKHRVAVSSLFRYHYGPLDSAGFPVVLERLIKTSSHEIGHMFGCQHCTNAVCLMNGSNSLEESDSRPNRLCSECLQKLQWNLNLDVYPRLEAMQGFFSYYNLEKDYQLALKDLTALGPAQGN